MRTKTGITTIIAEDEPQNVSSLLSLLERYCPQLNVVGIATTRAETLEMVERETPKLLFLDIHLPDGMGFELLENPILKDVEVVFTTASDDFALKAFEMGATHYLLKPIDPSEVRDAVSRVERKITAKEQGVPEMSIPEPSQLELRKLALPTADGFEVMEFDDINFFESSGAYTNAHLSDGTVLLISRTLMKFETMLTNQGFIRVHDRYLVNMTKVTRYVRGRGGEILLSNGATLPVSQRRKDQFLNAFKSYLA